MKIAIASDDEQTIASHFGRTRGFVIVDVDDSQISRQEFRLNTFTGHAQGLEQSDCTTDRHRPILTALADCAVVISRGMGRRLYEDLRATGIQAIITDRTDVQDALGAYISGQLEDHPEQGCCH